MIRTTQTLLILSILFLLVGCSRAAALATGMPTAQPAEELQSIASRTIEQLRQGDFAAAYTQFDSSLQSMLSESKLKETWEQIISQAGPYQKQVKIRTTEQQGHKIVIATCQFEKAMLDIQLGFNEQAQITGLFFSNAQTDALAPPTYSPPGYVKIGSFREVEVTIGSGEWALPGTLALPYCGNEPVPGFVLVHGSGPNDRNETIGLNQPFHDLAWGLASRCIAVLRYDKRTLAHANLLTPQVLATFTTQQEIVEDALLAVQLLRQTSGIDPEKIYLLGHSEGGMLAPRIAQKDPNLAGLVLLAAPTRPFEELPLDQLTYLYNLDGVLTDQERANLEAVKRDITRIQAPELPADLAPQDYPLGISPAYWLDLRGYEPAKVAKTLSMQLLILQGERDYQILASKDFAGWKAALEGKENATLKLYPQLNHLFTPGEGPSTPQEYQIEGHVSQDVISDIADWVGHGNLASQAPQQNGITLKDLRLFGLGLGHQVRSPLRLSVTGPANLQSVNFLIDGYVVSTVSEPPFQFIFSTDSYPPGWHEISAIGQTADGSLMLSNSTRFRFLSGEEANRILFPIAAVVILLVLGIWLFQVGVLTHKKREYVPLGLTHTYGIAGGSICPRCGRPFPLHTLAPELLTGKIDTCRHCGRVGFFRRIPLDELRKAEVKEIEAAQPVDRIRPDDPETKLRQQLDDSRYEEKV